MTRVSNLTLEEAYAMVQEKGKATPSVFQRIVMLEDFESPDPRYCQTVCSIPAGCKAPEKSSNVKPAPNEVGGIAIVLASKPKMWRDQKTLEAIVHYLSRQCFPGVPYNILYAARCRPEFTQKKDYSITQLKACSHFLARDLNTLKPKVVIVTSTMAAKAVGLKEIGQKSHLSRFYWPWEGSDTAVLMTLNPLVTTMIRQNASGAYWGNDFFHLIRHDFYKAGLIWHGKVKQKTVAEAVAELKDQGRLSVTRTLQDVIDAMTMLKNLPGSPIISWDTETTGLDPWAPDARFLSHQFGVTIDGVTHAITVPLWHRDNTGYDADEAWPYVADVLMDTRIAKVGHNGKFDLKYCRVTTGVEVQNYTFDTMYALHSICSGLQGSGTYTLKKAVWDYLPESGLGGYDDNLQFEEEEPEDEEEAV